MKSRIDVLEAPVGHTDSTRYMAATYPGEGAYVSGTDLIVVCNGIAMCVPMAARLVVRQDIDAEMAPAHDYGRGISEQTLLRAIVLIQRPELIKELPNA
ncbi:MAG: hypothetical protein EOP35_24125 [Rubrivivax sp.]|nr:MAG: hypothetical protein EOP35_24125 [Rubrivivax sp.]